VSQLDDEEIENKIRIKIRQGKLSGCPRGSAKYKNEPELWRAKKDNNNKKRII
jgi:hypothetical protein